MKKVFAMMLALMMLASVCVTPVLGAVTYNEPTIVIESVTAKAGDTIQVPIKLKNNPGLISAGIKVSYDSNVLELVDKAAGADYPAYCFSYSKNLTANPYTISFCNAVNDEDYTSEDFATLTFKVKEDAAPGTYPFTVTCNYESDWYNLTWDAIYFAEDIGAVTVDGHEYDDACDPDCNLCGEVRDNIHVYTNACDRDCNLCFAVRKAPHTYSGACDPDCNLCGIAQTVVDHTYDNACDPDCNVCGAARTTDLHVYDYSCDPDCNECGEVREVHEYDNVCDADCNLCGEVREAGTHSYKNACDIDCNVCGAIREVPDHEYDNACDTTCNVCGYIRMGGQHAYSDNCDIDCNVCGKIRTPIHDYTDSADTYCDTCGATRLPAEGLFSSTIDFTDITNRTAYSTEQQVWQQNGITITNDKGDSTSNVGDYGGDGYPARFYKGTTVTIQFPRMRRLVVHCEGLDSKYANGWVDSISGHPDVVAANNDNGVVTILFVSAMDSFTLETLTAQARAYSMDVYTTAEDEPEAPATGDVILDTNFDDGELGGWGSSSTISVEDGALKFSVTMDWGNIYQTLKVKANTDYIVSFKAKAAKGGSAWVKFCKGDWTGDIVQADLKNVGSDWKEYSFTLNSGDNTDIIVMIQYAGYGADGEIFWFDDITIAAVGGEEPEEPDVPEEPGDNYDTEIDTSLPYALGMMQENVSAEDVYMLTGEMSGYYMATTTDQTQAIRVYLEKTEGGYYLRTKDGRYINMVPNGTHVNGAYESTPSTVYNYDLDLHTLVADIDGEIYAFGTRNDKQYTTIGPVKVAHNGFHVDLYYCEDEEPEEPCTHEYDDEYDADCNLCGELREVPEDPADKKVIEISTAEGAAGDTVQVTVSLKNNPGIISAKVKVYYDTAVLKLVGYEAGDFTASGYSWGDPETAADTGCFVINWADGLNGNCTAELLATLTFEILEVEGQGRTTIAPVFDCAGDIFNANEVSVWFEAVSGGVNIVAKEEPEKPAGTIVVGSAEGVAGDTVQVTVSLKNNPGIVSALVALGYDSNVLELIDYAAGDFPSIGYSWGDPANNPFVINFCDGGLQNYTDELLVTLTFKIKDDAAAGIYAFTLSYNCEENFFDYNLETVYFDSVVGGVTVPDHIHSYTGVVTEPDCENGGYTTYTCSICGDSYVSDYTNTKGHSYNGVVTEPDCENGGFTTYTCSDCGNSYISDYTNAKGHSYNGVVTKPDCENGGYTTYTCSDCGDSYVSDYTAALGHSVVIDGYVAPNCVNTGLTEGSHCGVCGETLAAQEIIPATGVHTYDGILDVECNVCGHILGDNDEDGVVDNRDLALLQRYINGWGVTVDLEAADLYRDGKINNRDLALLQRLLNGWL